jgi:Rieske Fe-S protein
MEPTTSRRTLLTCLTGILGAACAAIVAVPGLRYSLAALTNRKGTGEAVKLPVIPLENLKQDKPTLVPVSGTRQDAWTTFPEQTIGRLWLVRRSGSEVPPEQAKINVFTAECPHMGCVIQLGDAGQNFVCPCHKAHFDLSGRRLPGPDNEENPALRDMDTLPYELVLHPQTGRWWVQVALQRFQASVAEKIPIA